MKNAERNRGLTPPARLSESQDAGSCQSGDRRDIEKYWFLTWTTYGTWLPGDERGFVSNIDQGDGKGQRKNLPATPMAAKLRGLAVSSQKHLKGAPVFLHPKQAQCLFQQLQETSSFRGWELHAVAIMRSHVHVLLGVPGDPEPDTLLRDLKSYASRKLNNHFSSPESRTWWTESGSRRRCTTDHSIASAIAYIKEQKCPLVLWVDPRWETANKGERGA